MEGIVQLVDKSLRTVLLTVMCCGLVVCRHDGRAFCTTRSVVMGDQASVTCHFPEDLSVHKHSVNIMRYDFSGGSFVPELVLGCFWKPDNMTPNCSVAKGFHLDGQISDTVTVSITAASQNHAGTFACQYSGAAPSEFNVCRLTVKRPRISCTASDAYVSETSTVTCLFNANLNQTKEGFYIRRIPLDMNSEREGDVLTCNWVGLRQEKVFCHVKDGCIVDTTNLNDRVVVKIPSLTQSYTGEYSCNTVPPTRGVRVDPCTLTALAKPTERLFVNGEEAPLGSVAGTHLNQRWYYCSVLALILYALMETRR